MPRENLAPKIGTWTCSHAGLGVSVIPFRSACAAGFPRVHLSLLFCSPPRTKFRHFLYPSQRGSVIFLNRPRTDLQVLLTPPVSDTFLGREKRKTRTVRIFRPNWKHRRSLREISQETLAIWMEMGTEKPVSPYLVARSLHAYSVLTT